MMRSGSSWSSISLRNERFAALESRCSCKNTFSTSPYSFTARHNHRTTVLKQTQELSGIQREIC